MIGPTGQTPEWQASLEDVSSESFASPKPRQDGSPIPAMACLPELSSRQEALANHMASESDLVLVECSRPEGLEVSTGSTSVQMPMTAEFDTSGVKIWDRLQQQGLQTLSLIHISEPTRPY